MRTTFQWVAHTSVVGTLAIASLTFPALAQKADNTGQNKNESRGTTADKAAATPSDRELMRTIRRSIVQDKALSSYAHNVKIVARNGMVTLKGPVRTEEEKKAIEAKAIEAAGADKVTSEITVAPKSK